MSSSRLTPREVLTLSPTSMAHGGEAIAHAPDGRVVFVSGAIPGDTVKARLSKVKVRWARAETLEVVKPSPDRVDVACPAARAGAGCCDYSYIAPETQPALKRAILMGQVGGRSSISGVLDGFDSSEVSIVALEPHFGWRTRVRLGVDASGKAGLRRARSNQILTDHACTQVVDGLLEGLVGEGARRFSPGSEVIAVMDSRGERHVVETRRAQRGKRVERMDTVVEGSGVVTEEIQTLNGETYTFEFPATAFWQAHAAAPQAYSFIIEDWVSGDYASPVGWDLYGGVGAFIPAIGTALGSDGRVVSVDFSESATRMEQPGLEPFHPEVVNSRVETGLASLPQPGVVVLDPPRIGAGHEVVEAIASAKPEQVIHIGCDPATFSRDLSSWGQMGYRVKDMVLVDAFPGTHHFEVLANLRPA